MVIEIRSEAGFGDRVKASGQNQTGRCQWKSWIPPATCCFVHSWIHFKKLDWMKVGTCPSSMTLPWAVALETTLDLPDSRQWHDWGITEVSCGLSSISTLRPGAGKYCYSLWCQCTLSYTLFFYFRLWGLDWKWKVRSKFLRIKCDKGGSIGTE